MKTQKILAVLVGMLAIFLLFPIAQATNSQVSNQIIVVLKPDGNSSDIWHSEKAGICDSIEDSKIYLISYSSDLSTKMVLDTLAKNPIVDYAEPNYQLELPENFQMSISFPDESRPPLIMGESPANFFGIPAKYDLGTDSAHLITTGKKVTVAVIDNGLDFNHPLFQVSSIQSGRDFIDNDNHPRDDSGSAYGHGTFVTGLVLLNAPDCKIMPIRAFNGDGIGTSFSVSRAIRWAVKHGADVINMSFGMDADSRIIKESCKFALDRGTILVAAAGNEGLSKRMYPAAYQRVIAVSAIDTVEVLADFSNYGNYVDVCAPGVNLYSSLAGEYKWGTWSGTSFAAPIVSAACALVKSINFDTKAERIMRHIRRTARRNLLWGTISSPDIRYGDGCIDIANAVYTITDSEDIPCGDADGNGIVNTADANFIVHYVLRGGMQPASMKAADVNCDSQINEADATYLLNFLLKDGPAPCCWIR